MKSDEEAYVVVSGKVQGVGLRYFVSRTANQYSLNGWVKNMPNKTVHALFQGDKEAIISCIELIKTGTGFSSIDSVDVTWRESAEKFDGFTIAQG